VEADEPVVAASVFKVAVALEFCRQVSAGELDPLEAVRVTAEERTPGPTGLSTLSDDAVVSLRDLASSMMAVSDNAATDILIARAGIDRINETLRSIGATSTHLPYPVEGLMSTMAAEAGLSTWDDVLRKDPYYERLQHSSALRPEETIRTTARDMTTLLDAIWTDRAGPPDACAEVRRLMSLQGSDRLGKRLAGAQVFAKSGSLLGIVRNEVGVVEFSDDERYAIAVFTRRPRTDFEMSPAIDDAIGEVARLLVDQSRL
jgi:beta-lactamase class A